MCSYAEEVITTEPQAESRDFLDFLPACEISLTLERLSLVVIDMKWRVDDLTLNSNAVYLLGSR